MPALAAALQSREPARDSSAPAAVALGDTRFVNHGLVGVGRLSASALDGLGHTLGSVSGLQITEWTRSGAGRYSGRFHILPDRGFNAGAFYAGYAARINTVAFTFMPHEDGRAIGGATDLEQLAAQRQITFHLPVRTTRFQYDDPVRHVRSFTTGLDPADGTATLFGVTVPYVRGYTGPASPDASTPSTYAHIDTLAVDAEALVLRADGSGYLGDEYGPHVYAFDHTKTIIGAIVPPVAFLPHRPAGVLNFSSRTAPANGRRENQGVEGLALSPDGTRLFVMLQSGTVQDGDAAVNDDRSRQTRVLVYDVSGSSTPSGPIGEYVLTLPVLTANGQPDGPRRTAAQSEIVALDGARLLVLARDPNGLGSLSPNAPVFKRVLLVDLSIGHPTNLVTDAARDVEGGRVTTAPGVLAPALASLASVSVVDILDANELARFNVRLSGPGNRVSKLTLGEKWEGLSLVPALDPSHPDDFFLFVANDNDFLTSAGRMPGPDGMVRPYDGFAAHRAQGAPQRIPPPLDSPHHENDTTFLVYRVTIAGSQAAHAFVTSGW